MTGYVRKDTTNNIADGNVINAADLDAEFDGIQDAFNASTGHNHDGTSGEGAPITALGPTQDVTISATLLAPKTTNTVDIGSSALKFKDLFLAGNGSIGGTLAVTGVATFTAQPILSSLTASRAVFSDGSKGLVSNAITGTGNVVMSASPTLTGTIDAAALTASGNLTLSGGTANGVAYLNGSKVVTSGSALTFDGTNLSATGTTTVNSANSTQVALVVKGETGNGIRQNFIGQTSSGQYNWQIGASITAAGNFAIIPSTAVDGTTFSTAAYAITGTGTSIWSVAGSEQMRLTSTGLGIGTSSPVYKLDVVGASGNEIVARFTAAGTDIDSQINLAPTGVARGIINATANGLALSVAGSTKAILNSSGNLGLGVTPSAWGTAKAFQIGGSGFAISSNGSGSGDGSVTWNGYYNGTNWIYSYTGGVATRYRQNESGHAWFTAPSGTAGNAITFTQAMTLDASGNLGVGTTSPSSFLATQRTLVIGSGSGDVGQTIYTGSSSQGTIAFADGLTGDQQYRGYIAYIHSSDALTFGSAGAERARIDSSGNLLVGTTTSSLTSGDGFVFAPDANASGAKTGYSGNTQTCWNMYSSTAAAYRFYVGWGGTVYATSTSISAISDQTLKTNIRDLETGLTEVMALKPRRFDWINDDATNVAGFIAQEVEQVLPELVTDYQYSESVTKKSLKMGDILPTLVKAIQEQQAIINSLKARLDAANL